MFNPLRDGNGVVVPHDESLLQSNDGLIRHINPTAHVVPDQNSGGYRISSAAFSATNGDPDYGMSVDLEPSLVASGLSPDALVAPGFGAVRINVGSVRSHGLMVGSDPIPPGNSASVPSNPHHGQIWGVKKQRRQAVQNAVQGWVRLLPGVALK